MDSPQNRLQDLLNELVDQGKERGIQLAVYHDGHLVVDACAGRTDAGRGRPVDAETLFPVFSVGKGVAATILHRLVERGILAYETRLAEVWPEFGVNGKESITLRHVLNHTAGLPFVPASIGVAELCDWDTMCAAIADLRPAWPPGSRAEYHAMTYGWLVGETAQRATGKAFQKLLDEEIREPLGLEALYMGIPDSAVARLAVLDETPPLPAAPSDPHRESVPRWTLPLGASMNRPDIRKTCQPGFGAIMSARAVARHYAALLPGGVDGVELLPPGRVRLAIQPQGASDAQGEPFRWMLGYHSGEDQFDPVHPPAIFGHDGHGGSFAHADLSRRLAVALTRNLFRESDSRQRILSLLREIFPGDPSNSTSR